ncbi:MAG: XRE family transcriptional regulator [Chloroflexi bacterium]|nr:XRE family transcriptional regulator [Chloroflexota bacterium]
MATETKRDLVKEGEQDYQEWRAGLVATPEKRALYEQIVAKSDLWLQLVEARQAAGLTQRELAKRLGVSQAQVARIERRGYDAYTLNTLRRYVKALGDTFELRVTIENTAKERASAV